MANLYHYTKLESALKIIDSQLFKFGHRENQNDPFENLFKRYSYPKSSDMNTTVRDYIRELSIYANTKISIGCFGAESDEKDNYKPTMWAHYAENHKGVCFVFDMELLMSEVKKVKIETIIKCINYHISLLVDEEEIEKNINTHFDKFLRKYNDNLLFAKQIDWSVENEIRIVAFDESFEIPICECLNNIYIGPEMCNEDEEKIIKHSEVHHLQEKVGKPKICYPTLAYPSKFFFFDN